jgi:hypothetical protein
LAQGSATPHVFFLLAQGSATPHVAFFFWRLARKRPPTTSDFFSVTAVPSHAVEGGLRLVCRSCCHC